MTDAGWAGEPKREGVYWFRWDKDRDAIIVVVLMEYGDWRVMEMGHQYSGALTGYRSGQFLGPITPTDRQQGRVEGLREAERIARNHKGGYTLDVFTAKLIADPDGPWTLGSDIAEKLAQAAQDEKPTKEDL